MRTNFLKRRDEDSYYVVDALVDIKAYLVNQITHDKDTDNELKKTAEDIIAQAFRKQKFARSQPYQSRKVVSTQSGTVWRRSRTLKS